MTRKSKDRKIHRLQRRSLTQNAYRFSRSLRWWLIVFITTCFCVVTSPILAIPASSQSVTQSVSVSAEQLEQQGHDRYEAGQFQSAIDQLTQALDRYTSQGDRLRQAVVLSNMALAYQQLGNWSQATQAIEQSLTLLQTIPNSTSVLAQVLNLHGYLQFEQGQVEQALSTWERTVDLYTQLEDEPGILESQMNQAKALRALGFYRRSIDLLRIVNRSLETQPDSFIKATGLCDLGNALQRIGDLEESRQMFQSCLTVAERIHQTAAIAAAQLGLGQVARGQRDLPEALRFYQQADSSTTSSITQVQARLNQVGVLIEMNRSTEATTLALQIQDQLNQLPASRTVLYSRINFAHQFLRLANSTDRSSIAQMLATTIQQAQQLGDRRAESYALGSLGALYEQVNQWEDAQQVTEQALAIAQEISALDIAYRWHWQLGRILKRQNQTEGAIAAYTEAVDTLKSLRSDLVVINPEVQFSFREGVEPVYREFVSLLTDPTREGMPSRLEQARQVIESLQLAELDNFFREACLTARSIQIDTLDAQAAVLYPILLPDRLEVILSIAGRPLSHHAIPLSDEQIEGTVVRLNGALRDARFGNRFLPLSQQVYNWLIQPIETDLENANIKTIVFVPDGVFRNLPISALHDGEHYLIERYAVAITSGLQLLEARSLQQQNLNILAAGLTEARQGFSPLPNVANELTEIRSEIPSQVLLNQEFTESNLQRFINSTPAPIIHLATHGQFSSQLDNTFILTWDDRITIKQLQSLLQSTNLNRQTPVELLVLSACQTAAGDKRAALGLAGVAVQAGARSTLATLWSVDDQATSDLMIQFYGTLTNPATTKAEALRRAQLFVLQQSQYRRHPYYWAPFVLVGNWL